MIRLPTAAERMRRGVIRRGWFTSAVPARWAGSPSPDANDDILGGPSPSAIATLGSSGASPAWSTNKQTLTLQLGRVATGELAVQAQINAGIAASGTVAATNVFTTTFDELGIGLGP